MTDHGLSQVVRRQKIFLIIAVAAAVLAIAGLLVSLLVKSPAQAASDQAAPTPSALTSKVEKTVLQSTVVVRGTVTSSSVDSVYPTVSSASTSAIVTSLPVSAGQAIHAGEVVAQVSGRPIIALPGAVPAYRDLVPGATGADVKELQQALTSLGYLPTGADDGTYGAATKGAVTSLYRDRGYDPITTSDVNSGEVATTQADSQAVTTAQQQLEADELSAQQASGPDVAQAQLKVQFDRSNLSAAETTLANLTATTGAEVPLSELVFVSSFPATVGNVNASVGTELSQTTGPLMTINVGSLDVTALVPSGSQGGIKTGEAVAIDDQVDQRSARGSVATLGGFINGAVPGSGTSNSDSQSSSSQNSGSATVPESGYPLVVKPSQTLAPSWLNESVSLTITTATSTKPVLAVPLLAVHTSSSGASFLIVLKSGGRRHDVPVITGLVAAGQVQVTPQAGHTLSAGNKIVTS